MMPAREAKVTQWGTSLGIRLPKEFTDLCNLKQSSIVKMEIKDGVLTVTPAAMQRKRKPLVEILADAKERGERNGIPAEAYEDVKMWLDSPSVGEEVIEYD